MAQQIWRPGASEMKRLKVLEEENVRLKRLVTNLSLDKEMLRDVIRRKMWRLRI
jgi:putative transposase